MSIKSFITNLFSRNKTSQVNENKSSDKVTPEEYVQLMDWMQNELADDDVYKFLKLFKITK